MTASTKRAELAVVPSPKFIAMHGRGGTGKSTLVKVVIERAIALGQSPAIADADRTNATLSSYFDGVLRPAYPDDASVALWLDDVVNAVAEQQTTVVLDMGGGDQVFKRFAAELSLADMMKDAGIEPVAIHMIGPDLDDLAYLHDAEATKAFAPAATAIVLNEGLIRDGRSREAAFRIITEHPTYLAACKRGARQIWFPRLGCMQEVNAIPKLSFERAATDPACGLGLTNRQRVAMWRREVDKALQPIAPWLP